MASTVIYQKRGNQSVKVAETPDLSPYATKAELLEDIQELDESKANIDGYYEDMTVGNAEQLVSEDYVVDQTPYIFRTAGGSADIGNRENDEIVGGTLNWNQLINSYVTGSSSAIANAGISLVRNSNNSATLTGTATANVSGFYAFRKNDSWNVNVGDVYFGSLAGNQNISWKISGVSGNSSVTEYKLSKINSSTSICGLMCFFTEGTTYNDTVWPMMINLTALFGTEIADYIYSLEQANAGAGVAFFRKLFPKDYYEYHAPSLESTQVSAHNMVGFNQLAVQPVYAATSSVAADALDKNAYTRVLSGQQYQFTMDAVNNATSWRLVFKAYDLDGNIIQDGGTSSTVTNITANTNFYWGSSQKAYSMDSNRTTRIFTITFHFDGYIKFFINSGDTSASTTVSNACLHLVWSGYRNGEYEPYVKHSYPLDSSLTLRGVWKKDSAGNLYCDGDRYKSDGTVERRYGIVDLGTLNWHRAGSEGNYYFQNYPSDNPDVWEAAGGFTKSSGETFNTFANAICSKYAISSRQVITSAQTNGICIYGGVPWIYDAAKATMTGADFKTAMSGVMLVYELATPTTESADPFQNPQIVDDFGTEEYVDAAVENGDRDVAICCGHYTEYQSNMVDKLRRLPNMPDSSGTYLVDYDSTTGKCEFSEYMDGGRITALEAKVPAAPTTDGTYALTVTVADGTPTFSWVQA